MDKFGFNAILQQMQFKLSDIIFQSQKTLVLEVQDLAYLIFLMIWNSICEYLEGLCTEKHETLLYP